MLHNNSLIITYYVEFEFLEGFFFLFFQLMISIVFKNMCMIAKISTDTKIGVYEKMQDCSLVFPGHLKLPTGRFCVVQSTSHSHGLQQVLAKFRLSMPVVSFVCTKDGEDFHCKMYR